jgi:hypothetical protein
MHFLELKSMIIISNMIVKCDYMIDLDEFKKLVEPKNEQKNDLKNEMLELKKQELELKRERLKLERLKLKSPKKRTPK